MCLELRDTLWAEYSKDRWARQRLRLYSGKRRTMARFFDRLEAGDGTGDMRPIVLAYGAGGFSPTGRGELTVPVKWVYQMCTERALRHPR